MQTLKIHSRNVKMVAHRGISWLEKENTSQAFIAAGNRSYWGIETDVHRTADGKFIIFHDDNTLRVSGKDYVIEETDFDTLRALPLLDIDDSDTRTDLRMPSLAEYIRICRKYEKNCVLELKNHFNKEDIGRIISEIRTEDYLDHVVFISFDFENLVFVRDFLPEQPVQFLTGNNLPENWLADLISHRFDADMYAKSVTEEIISALHENGLKVNVWTVNEPGAGEKLARLGVDYITTNILE